MLRVVAQCMLIVYRGQGSKKTGLGVWQGWSRSLDLQILWTPSSAQAAGKSGGAVVDRIRQHITFLGGQARASLLKTSENSSGKYFAADHRGTLGAGLQGPSVPERTGLSWVQETQAWNLLSPTLALPKSL